MIELEVTKEQHTKQPVEHDMMVENQGPALELFMSHKLLHIIPSNIRNMESGLQLIYLQMNATNTQARKLV